MTKTRVPAIDGWFTMDDEPVLLGHKDPSTGDVWFPKLRYTSPNPTSRVTDFEEVKLSRRGKIWSYTDAQYQPPEPYIPRIPEGGTYEPFAIAAVELEDEQMIVLGQLVDGVTVDDVKVGDEVELTLGTLYEDDDNEYVIWKWKPVTA